MSSLMPVAAEALEKSTLTLQQIGFTCSGSSDYLAGAPFSFVMAVDALGAWPPISDSHLERRMTPLRDRSRRGHEMTAKSAGVNSRGHRYCRRCHTEDQKRYRAKKDANEAPPPKRWNGLGYVTEANLLRIEASSVRFR